MRRFELLGRLVFDALDIHDAYKQLAKHFDALSRGEDCDVALGESSIRVRPVAMSGSFPAVEAPTKPTQDKNKL